MTDTTIRGRTAAVARGKAGQRRRSLLDGAPGGSISGPEFSYQGIFHFWVIGGRQKITLAPTSFGRGYPVIPIPGYLVNIRDIGFWGAGIPRYLPTVGSLFSEDQFLLWSDKTEEGQ